MFATDVKQRSYHSKVDARPNRSKSMTSLDIPSRPLRARIRVTAVIACYSVALLDLQLLRMVMTHVFSLNHENDRFCDIRGVVGDPLDTLPDGL